LILIRSVLQRQLQLEPWLARAGSKEIAACVLELILNEYPRPEIRMEIVRGLEGLQTTPAAESLLQIATSDDAPAVRSEAALAVSRLGMKDQLIKRLLEEISADGDMAAMAAFTAVIDEYGIPREAAGYPKFAVSMSLLQRRLKLRGRLIWRQGIRCASGGGLFLALNGLAAPFLMALSDPVQYKNTLEFITVPAWAIISALGLLILGLFQGLASGVGVGFADVIWRWRYRTNFRVLFGAISGLAMGLYLILFTLIGAISPVAQPSVYHPVFIVYGMLVGLIISFVIPPIDEEVMPRSQFIRAILATLVAALLTIPFVYLVYGSQASEFIISRVLLIVMLILGIATFAGRHGRSN